MAGVLVRQWRKGVLLCTFPIAYYVVIGSGQTVFVRYMTPVVPFLCITAAIAVTGGVRLLSQGSERLFRAGSILVALLVALPSAQSVIQFDRVLSRTDTRLLAARWLGPRVLSGETLFESGSQAGFVHLAWHDRRGLRLVSFDEGRGEFVDAFGARTPPDWIILQQSPLYNYSEVLPLVRSIAYQDYWLVASFSAAKKAERPSDFDQEDAFFLPYADLSGRERPGPHLSIYRRRW
jgi:hypothetical protein